MVGIVARPFYMAFLTAILLAGCGGSARSANDIAASLRQAVRQTEGAPHLEPAAEDTAERVVCMVLEDASSQGVETLVERLRTEAALAAIRADLGLQEYDSSVPERLVDAADEIDTAQKAAEVASLFCP